jgi:hypothetical protein
MRGLALAVLLVVLPISAQAQDRSETQPESRVDDVIVEGRALRNFSQDFVGEVSAPAGRRGLARWNTPICVGVVNLREDVAQYLADRVSTVGGDLGLEVSSPGCRPNILIVADDDAQSFARDVVGERRQAFYTGASGTNGSKNALQQFMTRDAPIRWWHVSAPIDSESGLLATRRPGDVEGAAAGTGSVIAYAPKIDVFSASRLRTQIRDDLTRVIIVMDMDEIAGFDVGQLGDYLSMIALAQIDPDAEVGQFETILNLFDDPSEERGLTSWDLAYLEGLYAVEQNLITRNAQTGAIAQRVSHIRRRNAEQP